MWKQSFFWTFPHYIAGGSAAGLLTIADRHNGWQITLLVVPMLYWMVHAYKLYLERIEQERRGMEEFSALHFRTIESLAVAIEGRDPERRKHRAECVERRTRDRPADGIVAIRILWPCARPRCCAMSGSWRCRNIFFPSPAG